MRKIVKIEILRDGIWYELDIEKLKDYRFAECRITERISKEEYEQLKYELDL